MPTATIADTAMEKETIRPNITEARVRATTAITMATAPATTGITATVITPAIIVSLIITIVRVIMTSITTTTVRATMAAIAHRVPEQEPGIVPLRGLLLRHRTYVRFLLVIPDPMFLQFQTRTLHM